MDFSEFLLSVKKANQAKNEALNCAAIILRRAQELPACHRTFMITLVQKLISVDEQDCPIDAQTILSNDVIISKNQNL